MLSVWHILQNLNQWPNNRVFGGNPLSLHIYFCFRFSITNNIVMKEWTIIVHKCKLQRLWDIDPWQSTQLLHWSWEDFDHFQSPQILHWSWNMDQAVIFRWLAAYTDTTLIMWRRPRSDFFFFFFSIGITHKCYTGTEKRKKNDQ